MPKTIIPYYQNLGGFVKRKSDTLVTGQEAQIAENILFASLGSVKQRPGFISKLASPSGDKIRVIHQHIERLTNKKTKLLVRGTNITKVINDTTEEILDSSLAISGTIGASAQLFDDSILCTGQDQARAFNSQGLEEIDMQGFKPQWCIPFNNFMVYGGDNENPLRIVFSALGDAKTVVSNRDFIDILDAVPRLTGAFVLFNSLWVTSIDTITKIDGSDFQVGSTGFDARVRTIWRGTGAVSHQAITVAHDRAYFLGQYGIYEFDGRQVTDISLSIEPIFKTLINTRNIAETVSVHDEENNIVIMSMPALSSNLPDFHLVYHYDLGFKIWSLWKDFEVTYWEAIEEDGEYPILWHGKTDGQLYRHGGEVDDDGVAVKFKYKTGWETGGKPESRFLLKHILPIVKGIANDTFNIKVFINYGPDPNTDFPKVLTVPLTGPLWGVPNWGAFNWGGAESQYVDTVGIQASVARNYSIEFTHESLGKRFELIGWSTVVIVKGLTN